MSPAVQRTPTMGCGRDATLPSPLAGEGAEPGTGEAGEGKRTQKSPSPGASQALGATLSRKGRGEEANSCEGRGEIARGASRDAGVAKARALRCAMTDAERALWRLLRDRRFAGAKLRRQVAIGPYIADFLSFECRLVVEVDGGQHAESVRDRARDDWFLSNGFRTVRFWNNDVLGIRQGVCQRLAEELR